MAEDVYEGLDPLLAARLKKMIADSGGRVYLKPGYGYRSVERQAEMWEEAKRKYGSEAAARKWVAPPGKSNHGRGLAADLSYRNDGQQWVHANAQRYGLWFPMDHEPWHIETLKTAEGAEFEPEAYTPPPVNGTPAGDPHDPGFQFTQMLAILDREMQDELAGPGTSMVDTPSGGINVDSGGASGVRVDSGARMEDFGMMDEPAEEAELMDELAREQT